jgi:hypothetical protein
MNDATTTAVIVRANVVPLEALRAIEDCLAPAMVVGFVFFLLIAAPEELALSSLKFRRERSHPAIHEIGVDVGVPQSRADERSYL